MHLFQTENCLQHCPKWQQCQHPVSPTHIIAQFCAVAKVKTDEHSSVSGYHASVLKMVSMILYSFELEGAVRTRASWDTR